VIPEQYVWLFWSGLLLGPWIVLFMAFRDHRRAMLWASLFTTPFGLTEPIFVPEYWNPPSLFDLARRTGFDIESLIFCFGIGGVAAVLYNVMARTRLEPMGPAARHHPHHRFHRLAISAPFLSFPLLFAFGWNPIYSAIAAMIVGALANIACRPDLKSTTWIGGVLFLAYYTVFLQGLLWLSPGYVDRVWNLSALSGVGIAGMPIEELLFASTFGMYWSGVYEHFTWRAPRRTRSPRPEEGRAGSPDPALREPGGSR